MRCIVALAASMALLNSCTCGFAPIHAFTTRRHDITKTSLASSTQHDNDYIKSGISRRKSLSVLIGTAATIGIVQNSEAKELYVPAIRPTAYFVDSTIPPTLIPLNAQKEIAILAALGKGSGTSKDAVLDDGVNLNNMMNKAVFGTINSIQTLLGTNPDDNTKRGVGYASFVCFGLPKESTPIDVDLAVSLLTPMLKARKSKQATALGLAFAPLSTQPALDAYRSSGNEPLLMEAMIAAGVSASVVELNMPLLKLSYEKALDLLAMSPELADIRTVRLEGLQNVDVDRRSNYVLDPEGFINLTVDKRFRMYTERSLQKDFIPLNDNDTPGSFFAERILVHETAASVASQYAVSRPDSFIAIVAPTPDVRYLCGINGRIPRICAFLLKEQNKVTQDAVTTILLNPTAKETLSLTRKLRLEIGTAPENLDVQTKVADYLWFSTMPKVALIPRLMNG